MEVHLINAVGAVLSESRLPLDSHPRGPSHTFSHASNYICPFRWLVKF